MEAEQSHSRDFNPAERRGAKSLSRRSLVRKLFLFFLFFFGIELIGSERRRRCGHVSGAPVLFDCSVMENHSLFGSPLPGSPRLSQASRETSSNRYSKKGSERGATLVRVSSEPALPIVKTCRPGCSFRFPNVYVTASK